MPSMLTFHTFESTSSSPPIKRMKSMTAVAVPWKGLSFGPLIRGRGRGGVVFEALILAGETQEEICGVRSWIKESSGFWPDLGETILHYLHLMWPHCGRVKELVVLSTFLTMAPTPNMARSEWRSILGNSLLGNLESIIDLTKALRKLVSDAKRPQKYKVQAYILGRNRLVS